MKRNRKPEPAAARVPDPAWAQALRRHWLAASRQRRDMAVMHLENAARPRNLSPELSIAMVAHAMHSLCVPANESMLMAARMRADTPAGIRAMAATLLAQLTSFTEPALSTEHSALSTHPVVAEAT